MSDKRQPVSERLTPWLGQSNRMGVKETSTEQYRFNEADNFFAERFVRPFIAVVQNNKTIEINPGDWRCIAAFVYRMNFMDLGVVTESHFLIRYQDSVGVLLLPEERRIPETRTRFRWLENSEVSTWWGSHSGDVPDDLLAHCFPSCEPKQPNPQQQSVVAAMRKLTERQRIIFRCMLSNQREGTFDELAEKAGAFDDTSPSDDAILRQLKGAREKAKKIGIRDKLVGGGWDFEVSRVHRKYTWVKRPDQAGR